jgi:RHS repeat-associated protein
LIDPQSPTGYAEVLLEQRPFFGNYHYTLGHEIIGQTFIANPSTELYITDPLGSVRNALSLQEVSGALLNQTFDAFGNIISNSPLTNVEIGYAGQWRDRTGQIYSRARYYQPSTGTFTTLDPYIGNPQSPLSLHKYLYAHANPVNGKDPSGWAAAFTPDEGRMVHAMIWSIYAAEHPMDNIHKYESPARLGQPGSDSWNLKPDILNHSQKIWAEIKPNTPDGYSKGLDKLRIYNKTFSQYGYSPEPYWPGVVRVIGIPGKDLIFWHDDLPGLILYDEVSDPRRRVPSYVMLAVQALEQNKELIAVLTATAIANAPGIFPQIIATSAVTPTNFTNVVRVSSTIASAARSIDGARLESSIGLAASVAIMVGF